MIANDSQDIFRRKFIKEELFSHDRTKVGEHRIINSDEKTLMYSTSNSLTMVPLLDYDANYVDFPSLSLSKETGNFVLQSNGYWIYYTNDEGLVLGTNANNIKITNSSITFNTTPNIEGNLIATENDIDEHNNDEEAHPSILSSIDEIEKEKNKLIIFDRTGINSLEPLSFNSINTKKLLDFPTYVDGDVYFYDNLIEEVITAFETHEYDKNKCDSLEIWFDTSLPHIYDNIDIIQRNTKRIIWADNDTPVLEKDMLYSIMFRRIPIDDSHYFIFANVSYEIGKEEINNATIIAQ